ncbi:2-dehydro-3-deoxygalactonokinase [Boseongicola sp. H5]|uniref:2-dehydro-3-deoxygalactonokinase n=1 Tax=Boseongicola sp. H5 TaxID=2763261 RepID=UPI001D0A4F2D|nr:2-dehydro-3-deoxygalactonokinase [Boseongicola sp. H5]
MQTPVIVIDWGSTNCRASLVIDGQVADRRSAEIGITRMAGRDYAAEFAALVDPWKDRTRDCVIFGMVTSRSGWLETPYAECPAKLDDLIPLAVTRTIAGMRAIFVPGVCHRTPHCDVIRGEELQAFGLVATGTPDAVVLLPGTHSKWLVLSGGRIDHFSTAPTGELFSLLSRHSLVGAIADQATFDLPAFERGAERALGSSTDLFDLFEARPRVLLGQMTPQEVTGHLSGLLIGAESRQARTRFGGDMSDIVIIGEGTLVSKYHKVLEIAGLSARMPDADLGLSGALDFWSAWRAASETHVLAAKSDAE